MSTKRIVVAVAVLVLSACSAPTKRGDSAQAAAPKPAVLQQGEAPKGPELEPQERKAWAPWSAYRVGEIDVYVARKGDARKPLVVMFQGSGPSPLFSIPAPGKRGSSLIFYKSVPKHLDGFHFAAIEKRGVESFGPRPARFGPAGRRGSREYREHADKKTRVADCAIAIRALARQPWCREIILLGHSEGAHVVTGLLRSLEAGTCSAAAILSSAGPTQFFGLQLLGKDRSSLGETFARMQAMRGPDANPNELWLGHPLRRWTSYALDSTPLEDVRNVDTPLFVAHGTQDRSSHVLAADLFVLEALRQKPERPLLYLRLHGYSHAYRRGDDDLRDFVITAFLRWAISHPKASGVRESELSGD